MAILRSLSLLILVAWPSAHADQLAQTTEFTDKTVAAEFARQLPLGLNPASFHVPEDNPPTQRKNELGRLLFFDRRLSADDSVACASCHSPEKAFADDSRISTGINGGLGSRNAPTVINRIADSAQFYDGRAANLEDQVQGPLVNPLEMGMSSLEAVVRKVTNIAGYRVLFEQVFNSSPNIEDLARAIASFERTIVSGNSRWDQYVAGDVAALTEVEQRGLAIFRSKARCTQCHSGWNLTDEKYHNIGIDWDTPAPDMGRFIVTNDETDRGAFKTPTLREVALTGPYMHDGRFATLEQVVDYYDHRVIANPYLDVEMRRSGLSLEETLNSYETADRSTSAEDPVQKLNLTHQEKMDLVAYMKSLAGEGWQTIKPPDSFPN